MNAFIQKRIRQVESWLKELPIGEPGGDCFRDECLSVIREIQLEAVRTGNPAIVEICQRRTGGINATRLLLAECLGSLAPDDKPSDDALIDLAAAAELLGYKASGLRKVVKAGRIRHVQNGNGPIKFRREWIDEYVKANNPKGVERSPSQRRTPLPESKIPGFNPSRFKN